MNSHFPSTRRTFLRRAGGITLGMSLIPLAGCEVNSFEPIVDGTEIPFLTPVEHPDPDVAFYVQHGGAATQENWPGVPALTRSSWQLTIDGLVEEPLTLTYSDLEKHFDRAIRILNTLRCIVDETFVPGLIGTTVWTGIPLRVVLDQARIDRILTRQLRLYGADGFTNNLLIRDVYGPFDINEIEPLLVYEMNDEPLSPDHGQPVRLLVPGFFGYKSVKWLTRIEAVGVEEPFGSYQEQLGYVDRGRVSVINKVTNPLQGQTIEAGPFRLFGYALSGLDGILRVELSIDDGPFQPADILPLSQLIRNNPQIRTTLQLQDTARFIYPFRNVWALWQAEWLAEPGTHTIRVRAFDRRGNGQPTTDENDLDGTNPVFVLDINVV